MNPLPPELALLAALGAALPAAVVLLFRHRRERRRYAALEESLAAYRMLFDGNPNPMYVYDVNSELLLAVNQTLCENYGYAAEELIGEPLKRLHIEAEHAHLHEVVAALRESRDPKFRHRWLHVRKSGEAVPVDIYSRPHRHGDADARLVVAIDISETLRAEEALANQHRFRDSLLETLPVPVFYKDRGGRYLGVNEAFVKLLGKGREHFVGRTAWDIAPPELAKTYNDADEALYAQAGTIQTYAAQVNSQSLGRRDVVFHKAVFRDFRGEIGGLVGIVLDVTAEKAAAAAVRESESRLAQILHNSPLPVFVIDADHRLLVWNPACEKTFGAPASTMIGTRRQWSPFYPDERPCMADIVLDGGEEQDIDRYYHGRYRRSPLNPDAFEAEDFFPSMGEGGRWLYFTASPLRDGQGRIVGAIETLLDISERRRAEREVQELNAQLEAKVVERTAELARANVELKQVMKQLVQTEKLAALGSLVAGVAHELNTPIGNVLTVATALQDRVLAFSTEVDQGTTLRRSTIRDFVDGSSEAASLIERNARRATELVGSFKQVAVDQTSMRRRHFRLAEILEEILSTLRPTVRRTSHRLEVDIPDEIELDSYPGPLEQVVSNLVLNSLLHGFEARENGTIRIAARREHDALRLRYADDGCGMSAAVAAQAFDPFFTTKMGHGGSGLGLYIVYNLVTAVLGGTVSLHSAPEEGVAFDIVLPLVAPHLAERGDGEQLTDT